MRQLETDLEQQTGLALTDYDVLAQLAVAEGLVRRADTNTDGRGVVVAITDSGVARLAATVPAHVRGIAEYFVSRLEDEELVVLERALDKVTIDCTFG